MIINFSFSNFRSVKDLVEISFEASRSEDLEQYYVARPTPKLRLLKMAAIYGANASGKSNVLLALDFLRDLILNPVGKKTDPIKYDRFAFDSESSEGNSEFNIDFVHHGIRYDYHVVLNPDYIVKESLHFYDPKKAVVFVRNTEPRYNLSVISIGSKIKISAEDKRSLEANTLWNSTVLGGYLKTNAQFHHLKMVVSWFRGTLGRIVSPKSNLINFVFRKTQVGEINKQNLIEIMQKADFNISDISQRNPDNALWDKDNQVDTPSLRNSVDSGEDIQFEHTIIDENGDTLKPNLPFKHQSLGTQRFYQFAGLLDLMIRKEKIVAIDEIESSLHPELLKHFLLVFLRNSKNSQLIFTTHQREFMRETDMLRNDIFHFTEKAEDGSTELFSFTDFNSDVIRKGSSLYNAYRIGKLGATPELDDAYIAID